MGLGLAVAAAMAGGLPTPEAQAGYAVVRQCGFAGDDLVSLSRSGGADFVSRYGCPGGGNGGLISSGGEGSSIQSTGYSSLQVNAPNGADITAAVVRRRMNNYRFVIASGERDSWGLGYRLLSGTGATLERCGASDASVTPGNCSDDGSLSRLPGTEWGGFVTPTRSVRVDFGCLWASKCFHTYSNPGVSDLSFKLLLRDDARPTSTEFSGPLFGVDVITVDNDEFVADAFDSGGLGIYGVRTYVDGQRTGEQVWDDNNGRCVDEDPSESFQFAWGVPCRLNPGGKRFELVDMSDGSHAIRVAVVDAAGNETSVYDRAVVTVDRKPPTLDGDPVVQGTAAVGSTLRCDAPGIQGQGPSVTFRWQRAAADGTDGRDIAGATNGTYTLTEADRGSKVLCVLRASDRGGSVERTSSPREGAFAGGSVVQAAPTPPPGATPASNGAPGANAGSGGTRPDGSDASSSSGGGATTGSAGTGSGAAGTGPGSAGGAVVGPQIPAAIGCPSGALVVLDAPARVSSRRHRSAINLRGTVRGTSGAPAAGVAVALVQRVRRPGQMAMDQLAVATSAEDGSFTLAAPAGPSRDLQVRTAVCGAASPVVRQTVRGAVALRAINPRVRNGQTVRFSGRVPGGYVGRGIGLELQVLVGRKWTDVRAIRTDRRGRYATSYRFRRTFVRYSYQFRVVTRAGSGWPFEAARSPIARVRVN